MTTNKKPKTTGTHKAIPMQDTTQPLPGNTSQPPRKYPHIVVRVMSAVYQREEIDIGIGEPEARVGFRKTMLHYPQPFDQNGQLQFVCVQMLIAATVIAVNRTGHRMCIVWGPNDSTFCEKDHVTHSREPPSGGLGTAGAAPLPDNMEIIYDTRIGAGGSVQ